MGLPNLSVKEVAMVKVSNILVERSSNAARELAKVGKRWIIENPVRRTIPMVHDNVLTLASSRIMPHFLWQHPMIVSLARDTGARVVHVPLC